MNRDKQVTLTVTTGCAKSVGSHLHNTSLMAGEQLVLGAIGIDLQKGASRKRIDSSRVSIKIERNSAEVLLTFISILFLDKKFLGGESVDHFREMFKALAFALNPKRRTKISPSNIPEKIESMEKRSESYDESWVNELKERLAKYNSQKNIEVSKISSDLRKFILLAKKANEVKSNS
ncbi:MAG TPA: hypothetical protein DCL41_09850 [Bdellovibrionales bacterium]|nr:hypothetical protein [Pseudobdellovibrionaceae bacterium]HAG92166.1 hypothetical protein [Bdellovibrionales bacterium]|tara:strand:- start:858 stop:1388 length:531 start_codon:yes stop_codon:yes gene_type:complete